jgi:hypothetical protein
LLDVLQAARVGPRGGVYGRRLKDALDAILPPGDQFDSDEHVQHLLADLAGKDLVQTADERSRKSQPHGLDHLFVRITAKGSALLNENAPPDPDVEDDRLQTE